MPSAGAVVMGLQVGKQETDQWIDNQDGDEWITLDNRLPWPIGVQPSYAPNTPNMSEPLTAPALTRSTLPIDPKLGVRLTQIWPGVGDGSSPRICKTFIQAGVVTNSIGPVAGPNRNVPYLLHSGGGAPAQPLYPRESWIGSALLGLDWNAHSQYSFYVGAHNASILGELVADGHPDICIMAVELTLLSDAATWVSAGNYLQCIPRWYFAGGIWTGGTAVPFPMRPGDPNGTSVIVHLPGASAFDLKMANPAAGDVPVMDATCWLGIPAGGYSS